MLEDTNGVYNQSFLAQIGLILAVMISMATEIEGNYG
jgi:hypothetical protein